MHGHANESWSPKAVRVWKSLNEPASCLCRESVQRSDGPLQHRHRTDENAEIADAIMWKMPKILLVWTLAAKFPNSDLNFAVEFGRGGDFSLFFSGEKRLKSPLKNPLQSSPGNSEKFPLQFCSFFKQLQMP